MLILCRGLPGSGKSFLAKQIQKSLPLEMCFICSTDDYWERPDGFYDFNPRRIGEAHQWNYSRAKRLIGLPPQYTTIIDNTNITWKECERYVLEAIKCGHTVEFKEPDTEWRYDVEECAKRNTHGVGIDTINKILAKFEPTSEFERKYKEMLDEIK